MKQFVSILIGLAFVMSAQAVPAKQVKLAGDKTTAIEKVQTTLPASAIKRLEQVKAGERVARPMMKARKVVATTPITITGNNLEEDMYWGMFPYIYGGNDEYTVAVFFWGETTFGTYKDNAEDLEIYIYAADAGDEDEGVYLEYTKAEYKMTEKGLYFYAIGTGDDGNLYEIMLTRYAPEQPKDTIRVEFKITKSEGDAYSEEGMYYVWAEDDKYACSFAIDNMVLSAGEYTGADLVKDYTAVYAIEGTDTTSVGGYYTASVKVRELADSYVFKFVYFATDSNYYELTIPAKRYIAPTETVKYDFGNAKVYKTYYGESGDFYLFVANTEYIMTLDIYGKKLAGTFAAEDKDFDTYYTNIRQIAGKDTTLLAYRNVEATVSESETAYTITAFFHLKSDNTIHEFKATYVKPTASKTETYDIKDSKIQDYRGWYGDYVILAAPSDSAVVFQLDFISQELGGEFTELDLGGEYTKVFAGGYSYEIETAKLTVTPNADETAITINGEVLATNNVLYKLTIFCQVEEESAIGKVESGESKVESRKIFRNGQILIVKDGEVYNLLGSKL